MRLLIFTLVAITFITCSTANKMPLNEGVTYTILFTDDYHPRALAKKVSCDVIDYKQTSKSQNQWAITFSCTENNKLKAQLLNNDKVISVLTEEEVKILSSKSKNKGKSSPFGTKTSKQ